MLSPVSVRMLFSSLNYGNKQDITTFIILVVREEYRRKKMSYLLLK